MSTLSIKKPPSTVPHLALLAITARLSSLAVFSQALLELVNRWNNQEEYSHGFLIPLVTLFLLWTRRDAIRASIGRPSILGPGLIALALAMHIVGELQCDLAIVPGWICSQLDWNCPRRWRLFSTSRMLHSNRLFALRNSPALFHRCRTYSQAPADFLATRRVLY